MLYKKEEDLNENCITYDQMKIIISFQKLWFKFAIWLKVYIRAAIYNTPNLKAVTNYLFEIPLEAYDLFSTYYSTIAAQNIRDLFIDFIKAAMAVIDAMKYGDDVKINLRIKAWYQNADRIAAYLARINKYWDENQWKDLLYKFIDIKIEEINAVINDNYKDEMKLYNMIENINYLMADYMARGIIDANVQQNKNN